MTQAFHYAAFGRRICSDLPLHLPAAPQTPVPETADPDLHVVIGAAHPDPYALPQERISAYLSLAVLAPDHWLLLCHAAELADKAVISVKPTQIMVDWSGASRPADVAQLVLTIGFAAHAYVSGGVCLHGCAIAAGDHAAMFVGESGAGKSSLTAALIAAGGRLLSEEVVLPAADPLQLRAGPEGVKISPAFAQRFGLQGNIRPAFEHPLLLDEGVVWTPPATNPSRADAALRQVYILESRNKNKALQLSPQLSFEKAAPLLAQSGYWYRVLSADLHRRLAEWGFRVATRCQVHRLSLPDDLSLLPDCAADLIARLKASAV
jgi:hypothetical protein